MWFLVCIPLYCELPPGKISLFFEQTEHNRNKISIYHECLFIISLASLPQAQSPEEISLEERRQGYSPKEFSEKPGQGLSEGQPAPARRPGGGGNAGRLCRAPGSEAASKASRNTQRWNIMNTSASGATRVDKAEWGQIKDNYACTSWAPAILLLLWDVLVAFGCFSHKGPEREKQPLNI